MRDKIVAEGQDPRGGVPQVSAWPEREDVVAVTDGGGKGERGIEREERSVGVGLESVGDSCRGVAGSISVDRRHKLFQWTQSSGSISGFVLLVSLFAFLSSLSLSRSFSGANLCVSVGRKCCQNLLFSAIVVLFFFFFMLIFFFESSRDNRSLIVVCLRSDPLFFDSSMKFFDVILVFSI